MIPGLCSVGRGRAVSHATPAPLRSFLHELPPLARSPASSSTVAPTQKANVGVDLVSKNPWLLEHIEDGRPMLSKSRGGGRVNEASGSADLPNDASADSGDEAHKPELVAATIFKELADARADAAACIDDDHFAIRPLGGTWTAANKHVLYDAWQGRAASRAAIEWAGRYRLPSAARFDISLDGAGGALCCAKYWCQKIGCFFQAWSRPYEFGLEDVALFEEPAEFTGLTESVTARAAQKRYAALRNLRPLGDGA